VATEDLARMLDEAGAPYQLLAHPHTESAIAHAEALGVAPADVAKTLVVTTPAGYVRAVLPASKRIDLRKLREVRGGNKKKVHLASEEDLARDYPEFDLGAVLMGSIWTRGDCG
jgi:Ala-tRNA(Pro) deacylase